MKYIRTPKGKITKTKYQISEKGKKALRKCVDRYQQKNPEKLRALVNKRAIAKLHRIPNWADLEIVKQFYIDCPEGYEVDHIIPLQGKLVSGLHVENNLQYLTSTENRSKGCKFDPIKFNNLK